MSEKERKEPAFDGGLWGDEGEREGVIEKVDGRISRMPESRKKAAYAGLVVGVAALFIVCVAGGAVFVGEQKDSSMDRSFLEGIAEQGGEPQPKTSYRFVDIGNLDFMSDDSLAKFQGEFSSYLDRQEHADGCTVKVFSLVDRDGSSYTAYASTSDDGGFHRISFDAQTKEMLFEPCEAPEGLAEFKNGIDAAGAAASAEGWQDDERQGSEEGAVDVQNPVMPAPATDTCSVADTAVLSTFLPAEAVEALPSAVEGYCSEKGISAESYSVNLGSVTVVGSSPYFEVICSSSGGEAATVSCEWIASSGQFGMSVIA